MSAPKQLKYLDEFAKQEGMPEKVVFIPSIVAIGRNVVWCPYLNEPAFLEIDNDALDCPNCANNYEPTSHPFICKIVKP